MHDDTDPGACPTIWQHNMLPQASVSESGKGTDGGQTAALFVLQSRFRRMTIAIRRQIALGARQLRRRHKPRPEPAVQYQRKVRHQKSLNAVHTQHVFSRRCVCVWGGERDRETRRRVCTHTAVAIPNRCSVLSLFARTKKVCCYVWLRPQ